MNRFDLLRLAILLGTAATMGALALAGHWWGSRLEAQRRSRERRKLETERGTSLGELGLSHPEMELRFRALARIAENLSLQWSTDSALAGKVNGVAVRVTIDEGLLVASIPLEGALALADGTDDVHELASEDTAARLRRLDPEVPYAFRDGRLELRPSALSTDLEHAVRLATELANCDRRGREPDLMRVARTTDSDRQRQRALAQLLADLSEDAVPSMLNRLLEGAGPALRAAVLDLVSERLLGGFERAILQAIASEELLPLAAAVRAAGRLGIREAESGLVSALAVDLEVAREAARSLSVIGTLASVEALAVLRDRVQVDPSLREAAKFAVQQIQSRFDPAEHGRLSIHEAAESAGALSLAGEGGALSVADDPRAPRRVRE